MTDHITVIAFPTVPVGKEAEFLQQFGTLQVATRAEPGCVDFRLHRNPTERHRFVAYEVFADQLAFDAHLAAPHTKVFVDFIQSSGSTLAYEFWTLLPDPAAAVV